MDWEPNERDAWVIDAQRWISKINGVLQCKIDLDPEGAVTGVHVVAGMDREPRHIVRDVESLLKARLGLDVYYKKIGVVQVLESTPPVSGSPEEITTIPESKDDSRTTDPLASSMDPIGAQLKESSHNPTVVEESQPAVLLTEELAPRLVCNGVGTMVSDEVIRAEVVLQAGEVEARGVCEGPNSFGSESTLVARAALEAVIQLVDEPIILHLNDVRQEVVGGRQVILTAVDLVEGRRSETLFGACACEHNRQQGVVYSILDALNRRLSFFALKLTALRSEEATA